MIKLKKTEYTRAINLFEDVPWQLSGKAVLSGNNPGQIYLDSLKNPLYGIMLTPEGIIISGNLTGNLDNFKSWINNSLLSKEISDDSQEFTIYTSDYNEKYISDLFSSHPLCKEMRYHYLLSLKNAELKAIYLPNDMTLERVSPLLIESKLNLTNMKQVKDWVFNNWGDYANFEKNAFGIIISNNDRIISWSLSDCKAGSHCEIGIHTDNDFRRQGIASKTITAMINYALELNYTSIGWHCPHDNIASFKTAEKCGFRRRREYVGFYGAYNQTFNLVLKAYNLLYKEKSLQRAINFFDSYQTSNFENYYLYDFACGFSLLENKEYAFRLLKQAIELGFTNAKHILHDKDLVFLHQFGEWDEIKKIFQK